MPPLFRYSDPRGIEEPATLVSLSSNVRFGEWALSNGAAAGDVENSTLNLEDKLGALTIVGLRALDVRELSAPSNNQVIGRYVIQNRTVKRDADRALLTGTARMWSLDLSDYNWHAWKRLLVDSDANRPAESVGDRLRWLLNRAAHVNLNDYDNVTYPSRQLEATDYRLQRVGDVLNDCIIEDQYNYWVDFNEAHGKPELFFLNPASTDYQSDIGVSNVASDVDNLMVFYPSRDAQLERSPSRIAFGAAVVHPKGFEYRRKDSTGEQYGKLDQVAPMNNVKSAARAGRLAQRFVDDNDEEDDVLTFRVIVPLAQVNDIRHGQLMPVRFQHLPGYETPVGVRVLRRTVISEGLSPLHYELEIVASKARDSLAFSVLPYTGSAIAALIGWSSDADPANYATQEWRWTGDAPGAGYTALLTVGPLTPVAGVAGVHGITADRDMVVRISAEKWFSGVVSAAEAITLNVLVNGVVLDSHTLSDAGGGAHTFAGQLLVDVNDVALAAGDVVTTNIRVENDGFLCSVGDHSTVKNSSMLIVGRGTHTNIPSGSQYGTTWTGP